MVSTETAVKTILVIALTGFCYHYGGPFGAFSYLVGLVIGSFLQRGRNDAKSRTT